MMPESRRVSEASEAVASSAPPPASRRSPNSSTLAIGVATTFALLSAALSLVSGASDQAGPARLGLRGSLVALPDTDLPPSKLPLSRPRL